MHAARFGKWVRCMLERAEQCGNLLAGARADPADNFTREN